MPTGDQTDPGSRSRDVPEAETKSRGPASQETDPGQPIHESETQVGSPDADLGAAPQAAGAGPAPAGVADLAEFQRSLVEVGLIDAAELSSFSFDAAEGVLGLSRALIKAGKLTAYQAAAIYQRKTRGLLIGNYLILERLGAGGMGVVFKARHRQHGRVVALKILPPSFARDRTIVLRFKREVEAARRLNHPNLVAAIEADEDRGVHFLVMDHVEGRDLDRIVRERGTMPLVQAIDCLIQAARGLEAAHAQGIVHRDIKPSNLMLDASGTVRVLDLGLALIVDASNPFGQAATTRLTASGTYMGTVDYMAPEQAEDSKRADHRADIYSLGCTLYYLLAGREPFAGETVLKRLLAHLERPAPSLRAARPEVSAALEAAYQTMMAKRPEERPASMTEVIALLEPCKAAARAAPRSRPELMVFDEPQLKRPTPAKTERAPATFAQGGEAGAAQAGEKLSLEDLGIDVRAEVPLAPLPPAPAPPPERAVSSRSRRQTGRGPVVLALGALAALGVAAAGLVQFAGPAKSPAPPPPAAGAPAADHAEIQQEPPKTLDGPKKGQDVTGGQPAPKLNAAGARSEQAQAHSQHVTGNAGGPRQETTTAPKPQWVILSDRNGYFARNIPEEAFQTLSDLGKRGEELKWIAFAPGGGWVIFHGRNGFVHSTIPDEADTVHTLDDLAKQGEQLKSITFNPRGGRTIIVGRNGNWSTGAETPHEVVNTFRHLTERSVELKPIAFCPSGGWVILHGKNDFVASNIPDEAYKALFDLRQRGQELKSIAFAPGGGWVILHGKNGFVYNNIPDGALKDLVDLGSTAELKCVSFPVPALVRLSAESQDTRNWIKEQMAHYHVPGLSIALLNKFQVEWARGYGVLSAGGSEPVTTLTRFQAGSISAPVTALAALRLAQQGKLDLNQPTNDKLVSWKVPDNVFTRRRKPTWRQVLSHTAGFSGHGFGGYQSAGFSVHGSGGHWAEGRLPTLIEILEGRKPANSPPIRVEFLPGSKVEYSGGGFLVLQQIISEVAGKPFPLAMQELVLDPVGMKQSGFQQPPSLELAAVTADGHVDGSPLPGRWHVYPELAAAGLWTTPSDLARLVIAVQQAAKGSREAILAPGMVAQMLHNQLGDAGLGIFLTGTGHSAAFHQSGSNAGFECFLIGFPETGQGAVLMTNASGGLALINKLLGNLKMEYDWPGLGSSGDIPAHPPGGSNEARPALARGVVTPLRLPRATAPARGGRNESRTETQRTWTFEGESLKMRDRPADQAAPQDMRPFRASRWSGNRQLFWRCSAGGRSLTLELPGIPQGVYRVQAGLTKSYDYGVATLVLDHPQEGDLVSKPPVSFRFRVDLYSRITFSAPCRLCDRVALGPGPHTLTITMGPKNRSSRGYMFGLDWIQFIHTN